jgi:two-component system NtrC family sensor kinase
MHRGLAVGCVMTDDAVIAIEVSIGEVSMPGNIDVESGGIKALVNLAPGGCADEAPVVEYDFLAPYRYRHLEVFEAEKAADMDYLLEEIPKALVQSTEGVKRIATIVAAMKEFAHPHHSEKAPIDLNRALESTLIVARNEIKYVADVRTDFGILPPVLCYGGDINQVFLNLLVNAAHAIQELVNGSDQRGVIGVKTRQEGDHVLISISDTGCGIPENIRAKIFEPFFTTKEVGRGTGQGLAIARSIVVEKHAGTLSFNSEVGKGSTFFISLPLHDGGET